jgi:uncharacterized membrane protein
MPCTPNPTTGFLMYVPKSEVVILDMTIEDGAKLIVSAGLVAPEYKKKVIAMDGQTIDGAIANPTLGQMAQGIDQPARSRRTASSRPNR